MDMPINRFKERLAQPEVQYGAWCSLADSVAAEIMAGAGFDWLVVDTEHSPNHVRSALAQLQAMNGYPVAPVVRLVEGTTTLVKQYLDAGFQTILVPMVETAEQAEHLVRATRYPPQGIRGVATTRSARWGRVENYHARANEHVCLVVQIETLKGLENLEAIAAVEGVDGIFIGPSDLGASMGFIGQAAHPEVVSGVVEAIGRVVATGTPAGSLSTNPELARTYRDAGATFVAVGVDTAMLAGTSKNLRDSFADGDSP